MKFYASLGNHDDPSERFYKPFNMNGERYYTFKPKRERARSSRSTATTWTTQQLKWLEKQLARERIGLEDLLLPPPAVFVGRSARVGHRRCAPARAAVREVRRQRRLHGPRALLRAHQAAEGDRLLHAGGSAKLREGDVSTKSELTAKGFDTGYHFMLIEITKDAMNFQVDLRRG